MPLVQKIDKWEKRFRGRVRQEGEGFKRYFMGEWGLLAMFSVYQFFESPGKKKDRGTGSASITGSVLHMKHSAKAL